METKFLLVIIVVCSIFHASFCDESTENKENSNNSAADAVSSETSNHEKRALNQYHQQISPNPNYSPNIYDPQPLTNNILYQQPQQQLHQQPQQHQGLQQLQLQQQPLQQYEQQLQQQLQQQPLKQYEQQLQQQLQQQQPLQQYEQQQPLQQYEQQHQTLQPIAEDQQNLQPIYRQKQPRIYASNQYAQNLYQRSQIRQLPTVPTPAPVYESEEIPTGSGTTTGNLQCQLPMPCLNPGSLPNNITRTWLDMPRVLYATVSSCWGYNQLASIHLGREVHSQQELEGMCPTQFYRNGTGYFSGFGLQFQKRCIPNRDGGFVCVNVGGSGDAGQDLSIQSILTSYLVGTDNKSYALFYRCVSGFADYVVLTGRPFIDKPAALQAVGQILGLGFPESEIKFLQCKP